MTTDTGLNKDEDDEEDDTMQNTVVLFSNTDKFVLLQVRIFLCLDGFIGFSLPRIKGVIFVLNTSYFLSCFRICVLCVAVLEKVWRGSCWLVPSVPNVTIPTV